MRDVQPLRRSYHMAAIVVLLACGGAGAAPPGSSQPYDQLQAEIDAIRNKHGASFGPMAPIEQDMLALAEKHNSPEERGRIYYYLTNMYLMDGRRYSAKIVQYAEVALQCPQATSQVIELQRCWGAGIKGLNENAPSDVAARGRHAAGQHYLQAYSVLLSHLRPPRPDDWPNHRQHVERFPRAMTTQQAAENEKRSQEDRAQWEEGRLQWELRQQRPHLVDEIAECFSNAPDGAAELRDAAKGIITDPAAVDELVNATKAAATRPAAPRQPAVTTYPTIPYR